MINNDYRYTDFLVETIIPSSKTWDQEDSLSKADDYLKKLYELEKIADSQIKILRNWMSIFKSSIAQYEEGRFDLDKSLLLYYHFGSYLTKLISYEDYILKFVHHTIQIGLPNREIKMNLIVNNTLWKTSEVVTLLKELNKFIEVSI